MARTYSNTRLKVDRRNVFVVAADQGTVARTQIEHAVHPFPEGGGFTIPRSPPVCFAGYMMHATRRRMGILGFAEAILGSLLG